MQDALQKHPVRGATASVNQVDETSRTLEVDKINRFGSYHNFEWLENEVKMWKAYGVGIGKNVQESSLVVHPQSSTNLKVISPFTTVSSRRQKKMEADESTNAGEKEGLFECPESSCNHVFSSCQELEMHLDLGQHSRRVNDENLYDILRREWAGQFASIPNYKSNRNAKRAANTDKTGQTDLAMGWALNKPRAGPSRFPDVVRQYLIRKFNYGQETGDKADPAEVATDMRKARTQAGERLFTREEWLTSTQVKSFFSRLSRTFKGQAAPLEVSEEWTEDAVDEANEEENEREDLQVRDSLLSDIVDQVQVKHPIFYDSFDLCDLYHKNKLHCFKIVMLKEICKHFDISYKSKDKKSDFIDRLSNMIKNCSCTKK